jgi:hypothetical protein
MVESGVSPDHPLTLHAEAVNDVHHFFTTPTRIHLNETIIFFSADSHIDNLFFAKQYAAKTLVQESIWRDVGKRITRGKR